MRKVNSPNIPIKDAEFCVVDVETTGLSPSRNGIIEIGIVKVSKLKIVDTYHSFINPGKDIPFYITQLTGITNEDVYDAPFFEDVADEISEFFSETILSGHNLSFDFSFLRKEFNYCGMEQPHNDQLCTLKLARRLYPALKSKSLSSVARYLNLRNKNAHRALDDAEVTAKALIKMIKTLEEIHEITSVSEVLNFQKIPKSAPDKIKIKKQLSNELAILPDSPGVYYFLNSKKEIIYIGKAKSLRNRVRSYFNSTAPRKAKKIVKQASHLKIEITNSELTALLMEAETIKMLNPRHNFQLKRYGNKYFLRITNSHAAPKIEISNQFDFDGNDYFGLFISRKKAVLVYEMLNKTFAIRECTNTEFNKKKKCFLAEIERCTAPCINI